MGELISNPVLVRPRALLLDFGGVIVSTTRRPSWTDELATEIHERFTAIGCAAPSFEQVRQDIRYGADADSRWKDAMSRPHAPRELTHREYWADFVAADWPGPALAWVTAEATALCKRMGELRQDRTIRSGLTELLDTADAHGIPVGVVSNALSGAVHRDFLRKRWLDGRFAVQIYSDEVGVRKPNPAIIRMAAAALDASLRETWYVGDNFDRDLLCARRAGVGGAVIVEDKGTHDPPFMPPLRPDALLPDLHALRVLLDDACTSDHHGGTP